MVEKGVTGLVQMKLKTDVCYLGDLVTVSYKNSVTKKLPNAGGDNDFWKKQ